MRTVYALRSPAPRPTQTRLRSAAGEADRTTNVRVTVTAMPAWVLDVSFSASGVQACITGRVGVHLTRINSVEPVLLAVERVVSGITATVGIAARTGDTSSLNVAVASGVAPGVYPPSVRVWSTRADHTVLRTVDRDCAARDQPVTRATVGVRQFGRADHESVARDALADGQYAASGVITTCQRAKSSRRSAPKANP